MSDEKTVEGIAVEVRESNRCESGDRVLRRMLVRGKRQMILVYVLSVVLGVGVSALGQAARQDVPAQTVPPPPLEASGVYRVGGGVKPPVPVLMPDPEFSKEARRKKISGSVMVGLIVDAEGKPQQVHVKRSLAEHAGKKELKAALSLDAKAVEAVQQYRFKPAMRDGQAVPVEMNVEVNFQIF